MSRGPIRQDAARNQAPGEEPARDPVQDEKNFQAWQRVLNAPRGSEKTSGMERALREASRADAEKKAAEERGAEWLAFWRSYFRHGEK